VCRTLFLKEFYTQNGDIVQRDGGVVANLANIGAARERDRLRWGEGGEGGGKDILLQGDDDIVENLIR